MPLDFMNLPLLMMRNRQGEVQVFHNVCSHRGMKLVHEAGEVQGMIRCPYHSWTYDLDGNLKGTPHIGGIAKHKDDRFKCEKHGLKHFVQPFGWTWYSSTYRAMQKALKTISRR